MKIVVVGAGVAGLTLALELHRRGQTPVVLERSPGPRAAGYMVDFFGPGYDAAARMDLLPELERIHYEIPRLSFRGPDGREQFALSYRQLRSRLFGGQHFNFMRGDLEQVLYRRAADTVDIRFGTSVSGIEAAGAETAAVLTDGSHVVGDAVVGADGVHSAVRHALFGADEPATRFLEYDTAAYIFEDPQLHHVVAGQFAMLTGGDRQISLYPISDGRVATFLLHRRERPFEPRDPAAVRAELHRVFGGFGWLVPDALAACGPDCRPYYDAVEQVVLPNWSVGRTVLLGDAAWCVSLLAGQGVSLAMAGAYVLAQELAATTDVPRALSRYERRMRPLAEAKQEEGRRTAQWFIPQGKIRNLIRDWALRISLWPGIANIVRRRFLGGAHLPPPAGGSPA